MNKKIILPLIIISSFIFSACTKTNTTVTTSQTIPTPIVGIEVKQKSLNCQPKEIEIEGYGDKGKMLANCFVQYPGEPSREDKSYYIFEDICGQFTDKLVSASLGKNIIKTKSPDNFNANNCTYYIDDKEYVMLVLNYLSIDNQKKGHESMDRKTVEDPKIPMRNLVVYQENGQINSIYLILSDDKFISIQRSSVSVFTSDELINFAANIGQVIKNYK